MTNRKSHAINSGNLNTNIKFCLAFAYNMFPKINAYNILNSENYIDFFGPATSLEPLRNDLAMF